VNGSQLDGKLAGLFAPTPTAEVLIGKGQFNLDPVWSHAVLLFDFTLAPFLYLLFEVDGYLGVRFEFKTQIAELVHGLLVCPMFVASGPSSAWLPL